MEPDFVKGQGLLPTVVQDSQTKEVLMVAWMNQDSYKKREKRKKLGFGRGQGRNYGIREKLVVIYKRLYLWP